MDGDGEARAGKVGEEIARLAERALAELLLWTGALAGIALQRASNPENEAWTQVATMRLAAVTESVRELRDATRGVFRWPPEGGKGDGNDNDR